MLLLVGRLSLVSPRPRFDKGTFLAQVAFAENSLTEARHRHGSSLWREISSWQGGDDEGQAAKGLTHGSDQRDDLSSVQVCDMEPFWEKDLLCTVSGGNSRVKFQRRAASVFVT